MAHLKSNKPKTEVSPVPPSTSCEEREAQMVAMAMDVAERQLREGTISSQTLTYILKLGSRDHELELEKLRWENKVLKARVNAYEAAQATEKRYREAIEAVLGYQGRTVEVEDYSNIFGDEEAI